MEALVVVAGWVLIVVGLVGTAAYCMLGERDLSEPPRAPHAMR